MVSFTQSGRCINIFGWVTSPIKRSESSISGGNVRITDGPDIEAKEVVGGYWLIDVKYKEETVEWAKKVPTEDGDVNEIRQIFKM